jgi:subtilisin family serine protease
MKKYYFVPLLLLLSLQSISQTIGKKTTVNNKNIDRNIIGRKTVSLSPSTAILLSKITNSKSSNNDSLFQEYSTIKKNNIEYVKAFLLIESDKDLTAFGFIEHTKNGNLYTGLIEIEKIESLARLEEVKYIEIAKKGRQNLNSALLSSRVDRVHQGVNLSQSYFGDGVVVGIIDGGFDYTHPSFYDTSFTNYRVKRVWEQDATNGTPPQGYSYGRELVGQTNILAAQTDGAGSHGTHVAGTAAGSGAGTSGLYKGVAPKSDLVLVSLGGSNLNLGIAEGVDYIIKYANSVNKPCVINMSLGIHIGPHDGTSALDQIFDSLAGSGKLLVGAAGNEGLDSIYLEKSFSGNDTVLYSFFKFPNSTLGTNGIGTIDIWGIPNQQFSVSVNIYNTNTDSFEDWTPYISSNSNNVYNYTLQDNDVFSDDCLVAIGTQISPLNNKPNIQIQVDHTDQDDNYKWVLIEIIGKNTTTKMWTEVSYFTSNGYLPPILGGSTSSTVGEIGGTSNSVITVGAYTSKNSYMNFNNSQQNIPFQAPIGEIAPFSSHGPTADNRTKPDVTAPGNVIVAPVNSFDPNYSTSNPEVVYGVTNGTKNWYYAAMQGTSMASPMVTGILALWLEANPNLTPSQVRTLLQNNSKTDSFTGTISANGDNTWGWGKIDAYDGLVNIVGIGENGLDRSILSVYPNPNSGNIFINSSDNEVINLRITDLVGRLVIDSKTINQGVNNIDARSLKNGLYLLVFEKNGINYTHKLMISK